MNSEETTEGTTDADGEKNLVRFRSAVFDERKAASPDGRGAAVVLRRVLHRAEYQ